MLVTFVLLLLGFLLVIGLPVAFAMAVSGAIGLYLYGGMPILSGILGTTPLTTANSYEMITIPMFVLMAEFVILSGIASDLFKAATVWVGRIRGGVDDRQQRNRGSHDRLSPIALQMDAAATYGVPDVGFSAEVWTFREYRPFDRLC